MYQLDQIVLITIGVALLNYLMEAKFVQTSVGIESLDTSMVAIAQAADAWSPPIQITKGGTYTGRWRSLSPDIPAVKILTNEPVIIKNCQIQSAGDGIWSLDQKAQLTVRNCLGRGLNPNIANRQKGHFINIGNFSKVIIENNTIVSFGHGIRALNYGPATEWSGQTVRILYNRFQNVDGRLSDGQGGYLATLEGSGSNAIGLNTLRRAKVKIAWNQVINQPFYSSVEDLISTYKSSGTSADPIAIHDNYLQGGYAPDPGAYVDRSGAMINVGDDPDKGDVGHVDVYNNQVVSFENSGILISAGHDNRVYRNRVVSAQRTSDGLILGGTWRSGLVLWDYYNGGANGHWYNNSMYANKVNVVGKDGKAALNHLPSVGGTNEVTETRNPSKHLATQADERAEYRYWRQKLVKAGVRIGCWSWKRC